MVAAVGPGCKRRPSGVRTATLGWRDGADRLLVDRRPNARGRARRHAGRSRTPPGSTRSSRRCGLADATTFVEACAAARNAQRDWARVPAPVRGRAIQQLGRLVEDNAETLARIMTREIGKPIAEARGSVQEVVDTCNFFVSEGRRLYGMTVPSELPDKQLFTFRNPVGVAAIVTAGNFPVAVPSWYLVPALLCGNAVVWKPAEYAPATVGGARPAVPARRLPRRGVQHGARRRGRRRSRGSSQALDAGLVDKVGFTGSSDVGRRLGELCGRHLQTPCLELGGKNPLVVMPDADLELAVEGALFSGFGTAGQRCTSLGTVIVHEGVHDDFLERYAEAVETAPIGDPFEDVLYGPMISSRFCERFLGWLDWVQPHHTLRGSTGTGRITRDEPARGLRRRSRGRAVRAPDDRRRRHDGRRPLQAGDVRADRGRGVVRRLRRGDGARERPRLRPVGLDLHDRPAQRVPVPRAHLARAW